jgi:(E)-4-hydroxy-3-methylbut-2-enyl-diphosphate synthase
MGCVVNGPGECRNVDVGIAGGDGKVLVYRHGNFSHSISVDAAYDVLASEIRALASQMALEHRKDMR